MPTSPLKSITFALLASLISACGASGGGGDDPSVSVSTNALPDSESHTEELLLSWGAPTKRIDGSALTNDQITHYEINYANRDATISDTVIVNFGSSESIVLQMPPPGDYNFSIVAVTTDGGRSPASTLNYTL